jgi:hypothetical protein
MMPSAGGAYGARRLRRLAPGAERRTAAGVERKERVVWRAFPWKSNEMYKTVKPS